ncbi:MAG: hypothetical protein R3C02_24660 [Planctomycetaceae bacterium]
MDFRIQPLDDLHWIARRQADDLGIGRQQLRARTQRKVDARIAEQRPLEHRLRIESQLAIALDVHYNQHPARLIVQPDLAYATDLQPVLTDRHALLGTRSLLELDRDRVRRLPVRLQFAEHQHEHRRQCECNEDKQPDTELELLFSHGDLIDWLIR